MKTKMLDDGEEYPSVTMDDNGTAKPGTEAKPFAGSYSDWTPQERKVAALESIARDTKRIADALEAQQKVKTVADYWDEAATRQQKEE